MRFRITLNLGGLNAELVGENRQEIQDELVEFINFIEQNGDVLESYLAPETGGTGGTRSAKDARKDIEEPPLHTADDFGDIPDRTGFDTTTLSRYFDLDPDGDEPPYLNFDAEVLGESGSSRSEKQMRASLILFTLWRECSGVEKVMSPDLKDALRISGIDDTKVANMYQFNNSEGNRYFRREGSGQNTEMELTLPGRREGYDQIHRTVELIEPDESE